MVYSEITVYSRGNLILVDLVDPDSFPWLKITCIISVSFHLSQHDDLHEMPHHPGCGYGRLSSPGLFHLFLRSAPSTDSCMWRVYTRSPRPTESYGVRRMFIHVCYGLNRRGVRGGVRGRGRQEDQEDGGRTYKLIPTWWLFGWVRFSRYLSAMCWFICQPAACVSYIRCKSSANPETRIISSLLLTSLLDFYHDVTKWMVGTSSYFTF